MKRKIATIGMIQSYDMYMDKDSGKLISSTSYFVTLSITTNRIYNWENMLYIIYYFPLRI